MRGIAKYDATQGNIYLSCIAYCQASFDSYEHSNQSDDLGIAATKEHAVRHSSWDHFFKRLRQYYSTVVLSDWAYWRTWLGHCRQLNTVVPVDHQGYDVNIIL